MTVKEEIYAFLDEWPDAEFGPGHIVLSDYNLEDEHIKWCVALCRAALSRNEADLLHARDIDMMERLNWYQKNVPNEIIATVAFLEHLLTIPEAIRCRDLPDA